MNWHCFWLGVIAFAYQPVIAPAQSRIEAMLKVENPCRSLPGIDKLKRLRVETVEAKLEGDALELSARGFLHCQTSDKAFFKTDASANVDGHAQVSIADCKVIKAEVRFRDFGGRAGEVAALFAQYVRPKLERELSAAVEKACADIGDGM